MILNSSIKKVVEINTSQVAKVDIILNISKFIIVYFRYTCSKAAFSFITDTIKHHITLQKIILSIYLYRF